MIRVAAIVIAALMAAVAEGTTQEAGLFFVTGERDGEERLEVARHRGFVAVRADALESLGWRVAGDGQGGVRARLVGGPELHLRPGTPYFRWDDEVLQLVEAPYRFSEQLHVPVQLVTDLLPSRLGDRYAWDADRRSLRVRGGRASEVGGGASGVRSPTEEVGATSLAGRAASGTGPAPAAPAGAEEGERASRVVVIDAGHGGKDTGARGAGGVLEKEVALAVARALARELEADPAIEVRLVRSDDRYVPIWARGDSATAWKGDQPGIFLSIHANAVARSRTVRGFETYFLSEARTDHERRVAALENAPLQREREDGDGAPDFGPEPDLGFILNELRNHDYVHWSSLLAELVQREIAAVHPGPDRGVKQGPFAVITNALMPGVLVELGFITNSAEERLLGRRDFQQDVGRSLARAVRAFFERYPPQAGTVER